MPPNEFAPAFEGQHFGDEFRLTTDAPAPKPGERKPRDPAAQRARKAAGKAGERVVEQLHEICLAAGVARMAKIEAPMRIVGSTKRGKQFLYLSVHAAKSGVDYRGHLITSGKAVYVEAKAVTDPDGRFYLRDVRDAQCEQLDDGVRDGCVCVLVIIRAGHVYAVPWSVARTHVALGDAELRDWFVKPGTAYLARWSR
jgi:hypothetical protein